MGGNGPGGLAWLQKGVVMQAEALLREGKLDECVAALAGQIRSKPQDPKLRIFLFQLSVVMGQWDRAIDQLDIAAQMDPAAELMAQVCRPAIQCERFRQEVFAGQRTPLVIGQPEEWLAHLIQAAMLSGQGKEDAAAELRTKALDAAPTTSGTIQLAAPKGSPADPQIVPIDWICDEDLRLGPVLEAIIEGKYYWVPFNNILMIEIDPPADLRDMVWAPARIILAAGGEKVALIPTRYPGSEAANQPAQVRLAKTTVMGGADGETPFGIREWKTDQDVYSLFQIASIKLGDPEKLREAMTDVHTKRAEEMRAKLVASGALKTGMPGGPVEGGGNG